jgi:hypothetical protein
MRWLIVAIVALLTSPALAQSPGWHYSPLPGEGDRAAMGCNAESTPEEHACLVARCEDDNTIGFYLHTTAPGELFGRWKLSLDRETPSEVFLAQPRSGSPYDAELENPPETLLDGLKNGAFLYLDRQSDGWSSGLISLSGSLYAINQALYFCAPPEPEPDTSNPSPEQSVDPAQSPGES